MLAENIARAFEATYSTTERKFSGTHYTPDNVVEYIVGRTIGAGTADPGNCRILDPACGSGLFLLKAYEIVCANLKQKHGTIDSWRAREVLESCIFGIDIDPAAVKEARQNLLLKAGEFGVARADLSSNFIAGDALDLLNEHKGQLGFDFEQAEASSPLAGFFPRVMAAGGFDCVIGNPPYIRIQNIFPLERRNKYIKLFRTAAGRFDISALFMEFATRVLSAKGRLGYVVSNKLLTTNGSRHLRQFIVDNFTIEEIVDLADTKLFDAAILPMIVILRRGRHLSEQIIFTTASEIKGPCPRAEKSSDIFEVLTPSELPLARDVEIGSRTFSVRRFAAPHPTKNKSIWTFHSPAETRVLEKIWRSAAGTLNDFAEKISVGLKTTADDVFIKPLTESFIGKSDLERDLIHPVLESHNIQRWSVRWQAQEDCFVLYPYREINGKLTPVDLDRFPQAKKYLFSHRDRLTARSYLRDSGRQWFEIWVHQSPRDFAKIKIITPDISATNRFALDQAGYFVNGTCFYIILSDQSLEMNQAVLALLNSKLMEYFHKTTCGNVLYAKRFRYWTTYLRQYPVPRKLHESSKVRQQLANTARQLELSLSPGEIAELENNNDRLVYELFGLNDSDVDELEKTLRINRAT